MKTLKDSFHGFRIKVGYKMLSFSPSSIFRFFKRSKIISEESEILDISSVNMIKNEIGNENEARES